MIEILAIVPVVVVVALCLTAYAIAKLKYGNNKEIERLSARLDAQDAMLKGIESFDELKKDINELKIKTGFTL